MLRLYLLASITALQVSAFVRLSPLLRARYVLEAVPAHLSLQQPEIRNDGAFEAVQVLFRAPNFAVVNKPGSIPCHDSE